MARYSNLVLLTALLSVQGEAALSIRVLSSVVYSRYGDRTPLVSTQGSVLTPYGAQQMYKLGQTFNSRYLTAAFDDLDGVDTIYDISHYQLDNGQVDILTTDETYAIGSAQAFMQGLYPALDAGLNETYMPGVSTLANGSELVAPLNGYQYPAIRSLSSYDMQSIWIDGASNCPAVTTAMIEYYKTDAFAALYNSTVDFYDSLWPGYLSGTFTPNSLGYFESYYIWDYMQYQYLHNKTFADSISDVDLVKAEVLAADWVYAMYGNASNAVTSMGGRTLASKVRSAFSAFIQTSGNTNKLNLYFGDYQPMTSFAALATLTSPQNGIFYSIPAVASSFVFELVALLDDDQPLVGFPSTTDMFVRFYYQNGTGDDDTLVPYPLFGRSPSNMLISYSDFINEFGRIDVNGTKEWCETCQSYALFCPAFTDDYATCGTSKSHNALTPAIAGVIGAMTTLAFAAIVAGLAMAVGGLRVHRREKSQLGGFKGSEKLASDRDLTIPKGGAGATVVSTGEVRGHERVGSWELRGSNGVPEVTKTVGASLPRRPSFEEDEIQFDPYGAPVKPSESV